MASKIVREITSAPVSREVAITMVESVSRKMVNELNRLPSGTNTNLHKITNLFTKNCRAQLWSNVYKAGNVTYADIMNGTMEDLRTYITNVNSYLNSLRPQKVGALFIVNSVYKGGYDSIKASGAVEEFERNPDACFNDAMLKPFFVAGCMNTMKALVKDHEAGKFEVNTTIRDKGQPSMSKLPLEPVSKTIPELKIPVEPTCANYRPVSYSTPHATVASAPM